MELRKEERNEQKKNRFQIEKLEERIAPGVQCAALAGALVPVLDVVPDAAKAGVTSAGVAVDCGDDGPSY